MVRSSTETEINFRKFLFCEKHKITLSPSRKACSNSMSNKFDPASEKQLSALLQAAKNGNQQAFEDLLDLYAPLIDSMTRQFVNTLSMAFDREDLRQEAILCFFHALMHFDGEHSSMSFGAYAKLCIRNGLISYWRTQKKSGQTVLLEEAMLEESSNVEGTPADRLIEEENYLSLYRLVQGELSEYENRIWWMYLSGRTAKEIAAHMEKDEKSVQNAIYRIRKKLRTVLSASD
ncbi:MAG: sigma-70 family RNA polymerase sigma factor [Ruminococcaceae bacterium]|nr:sigma-70 family RNA polymerase sigma factor [Oscillospiraceae bacterium]